MDSQEFARLNPTISRDHVRRLVEHHGNTLAQFQETMGNHLFYQTEAVLRWLGY